TEIKLVPSGDRLEVRVRGPNITPGYFKRPDLTKALFDAEGFYCPGDAMRLEDPRDVSRGLVFDGRIGENFKLSTGTWVGVGALRVAAIVACAPVMEDGVLTGHDRDEVGLLVVPDPRRRREPLPRSAEGRAGAGADRRARRARGAGARPRAPQRREHPQQHADRPRAPDGGAALDRQGRDHRQGLSEPARLPHP